MARFFDNLNPLPLLDPRRTARNVGAVIDRNQARSEEVEAVVARVSEAKRRHPSSGTRG